VIEKAELEFPIARMTDGGASSAVPPLVVIVIVRFWYTFRFMVTMQVPLPPKIKLGLHASEKKASGGNTATEPVWELVPSVAVTSTI
jgi:hypothetical protein